MRFLSPKAALIMLCIASGVAVLLGYRVYLQFCPAPVFVAERAPLPAQFSNSLYGTTSRALTNYFASTPYERAVQKRVAPHDLSVIRRKLAWGFIRPLRPGAIEVVSDREVRVYCRINSSHTRQVRFEKVRGVWEVMEITTGIE